MSPLTFELPAFLLGLLFGSFLNVCISRLPLHESIAKPRSRCPRCLHTIRWYDNVPLLSWVILRAHCRDCKAKIPWRYPLVELAVGAWFAWCGSDIALVWTVHHEGLTGVIEHMGGHVRSIPEAIFFVLPAAILGFLLIGLLVMDWQTHTLPDAFTLTGTAIGFFLVCVQAIFLAPGEGDIVLDASHTLRMSSPGSFAAKGNVFLTGPEHLVFGRLLAILAAALLPFLIRVAYKTLRGKEGLGLGDVKLVAMIAAFLGFWPAMLAFFLGSVLILPYAVFLLLTKRANRATQLPFGTFLCAGGLLAALFGESLLTWYLSLL
jgi:leader peptidase (prepilin peptidase)/N-methyltransferase